MMKVRKVEEGDKCEYEDCEKKATEIVYSRDECKVMLACGICKEIIEDEDSPEYLDTCPNCKCIMPIN